MEFQLLFRRKKYEIRCPIRSEMQEGPQGTPHSSNTILFNKITRTPREHMTGTSMLRRAKTSTVPSQAKSHKEVSTSRTKHSMTCWAWVHQLLVMAHNSSQRLSSRPTNSRDNHNRILSTLACSSLPNSLAISRCQVNLSHFNKSSLSTSSATSEAINQVPRKSHRN